MTRRIRRYLLGRGLPAAVLSLLILAGAATQAVAHRDRIAFRDGGFVLLEPAGECPRDAWSAPALAVQG